MPRIPPEVGAPELDLDSCCTEVVRHSAQSVAHCIRRLSERTAAHALAHHAVQQCTRFRDRSAEVLGQFGHGSYSGEDSSARSWVSVRLDW